MKDLGLPANRLVVLTLLAVSLGLSVFGAGCPCTVGSRHVKLFSTVVYVNNEEEFGTFSFRASQFRGTAAPGSNSVGWHYYTDLDPESVARVQVRQGPGPVGGDLLYELPTWGEPPWVPVTVAPTGYPGPLRFEVFYDVLKSGDAHVEFTLRDGQVASGPLAVDRSFPWQDYPCD